MPNRLNNVKSVKCLKLCKSEMTRGHTLKTFLKHLSHGLSLYITFSTLTPQHLGSTHIYTCFLTVFQIASSGRSTEFLSLF